MAVLLAFGPFAISLPRLRRRFCLHERVAKGSHWVFDMLVSHRNMVRTVLLTSTTAQIVEDASKGESDWTRIVYPAMSPHTFQKCLSKTRCLPFAAGRSKSICHPRITQKLSTCPADTDGKDCAAICCGIGQGQICKSRRLCDNFSTSLHDMTTHGRLQGNSCPLGLLD